MLEYNHIKYYTFREIIAQNRTDEVCLIYEDKPLHYALLEHYEGRTFRDPLDKDVNVDIPYDKLDTYGYHAEICGIKIFVSSFRPDFVNYLRKVVRDLHPKKLDDGWIPMCDRIEKGFDISQSINEPY